MCGEQRGGAAGAAVLVDQRTHQLGRQQRQVAVGDEHRIAARIERPPSRGGVSVILSDD